MCLTKIAFDVTQAAITGNLPFMFHPSKIPFTIFVAFVFALTLISSQTLHASDKAKKPAVIDHRTLVTKVDLATLQVTIVLEKYKQARTYLVDDLCTVTAMGNPGTIKDIKAGQEVYDYVERDSQSLASIVVGVARPPGTY